MERHRCARGTPDDIVQKLNQEINAAPVDPGIRARIADETDKWAKVVKFSGASSE